MAAFKSILISSPSFFPEEAKHINSLFQAGLRCLHIRKPQASIQEIRKLLEEIHPSFHPYIHLHDGLELLLEYSLGGQHLSKRNPHAFACGYGELSCSCHRLPEIKEQKAFYDYLFLSPIFSSISKANYPSAFREEDLIRAKEEGIIDQKVMALGGMSPEKLAIVKKMGFAGAAFLGYIWGASPEKFLERWKNINS